MIFKFPLPFYCLWFLVAGIQTAWAQSAAPNDERAISFRAVAWNRDLPKLSYDLKGKPQPLPLDRGRITPLQTYMGDPTLILYNTVEVDGKPTRLPLVQTKLDPARKKILIVVWQAKDLRYIATVLPDETDTLMGGQVRFVNLAGKKLAVNSNRQTRVCLPGEQYVTETRKGGLGIKVAVEMEANGKWELSLMNGIEVGPNERVTVFLTNPSQLAPAPEEEGRDRMLPPLDLFVLRDKIPVEPQK